MGASHKRLVHRPVLHRSRVVACHPVLSAHAWRRVPCFHLRMTRCIEHAVLEGLHAARRPPSLQVSIRDRWLDHRSPLPHAARVLRASERIGQRDGALLQLGPRADANAEAEQACRRTPSAPSHCRAPRAHRFFRNNARSHGTTSRCRLAASVHNRATRRLPDRSSDHHPLRARVQRGRDRRHPCNRPRFASAILACRHGDIARHSGRWESLR